MHVRSNQSDAKRATVSTLTFTLVRSFGKSVPGLLCSQRLILDCHRTLLFVPISFWFWWRISTPEKPLWSDHLESLRHRTLSQYFIKQIWRSCRAEHSSLNASTTTARRASSARATPRTATPTSASSSPASYPATDPSTMASSAVRSFSTARGPSTTWTSTLHNRKSIHNLYNFTLQYYSVALCAVIQQRKWHASSASQWYRFYIIAGSGPAMGSKSHATTHSDTVRAIAVWYARRENHLS